MFSRTDSVEFRCECCGVLLGKIEANQFVVRRGRMRWWTWGGSYVSVMCYNPRCERINSLRLPHLGEPEVVYR